LKNILIISPAMGKGGMERQLSIFLEHFDRSKYNVTLALVRDKIEYEIPKDIEVIQLNKKGKIDLKFYWKLFGLLKDKKWDIIQSKISGLNEQVMFLCGLLNKKNLVVEIRNSGKRLYRNYKNMNILIKLFHNSNSWKIITNSQKANNELQKFIHNDIKTTTIYNAIDTDKFKKIDKIKKLDTFTIGFVGRIQKVKNIELLINAISMIKTNLILEIYGNIEDIKYYDNLIELAIEKKVKNKIKFYNASDNIENIYNRFDLFILPSHHEGTPNVLLEAMACECICLISKGANSDNYLDKKFVFDTDNVADLYQKINIILSKDFEYINNLKVANRKYIIENFSIKRMLKKYGLIYED